MENNCSFCKELEITKTENKKLGEELKKHKMKLKVHYKIALVEVHERYHWGLMGKETFTHKEKGFYYCPLCGRKIRERKKENEDN